MRMPACRRPLPYLLALSVSFGFAAHGGAIELTLDEVVERALANSHELAVANTNQETVDARLQRSRALLPTNPFVSFSFWDTTASRLADDGRRSSGPSYTFSLSQTFEIAGQRGQRIDMARHGVEVAEANAVATRSNFAAAVRRSFYEAIEAHARVGFAFEALHWQRELRRAYAQSGAAAQNQAEMRIARAESEHEAQRQALLRLEGRLRQVLRLPPEEPLVLVGELRSRLLELPTLDALLAHAREHRADLIAHRGAAAGDEAALSLARRRAVPDLTLSGFVTHSERSSSDLQFGASIGVPLPVFRGSGPDVAEAIAARSRSRIDLENVEAIIEREVIEAYWAVDFAGRDLERIAREIVPRAEENLSAAERSFDARKAGVWELVMAELDRLEARREHTAAMRIYSSAVIELERSVGATLDSVPDAGAADENPPPSPAP